MKYKVQVKTQNAWADALRLMNPRTNITELHTFETVVAAQEAMVMCLRGIRYDAPDFPANWHELFVPARVPYLIVNVVTGQVMRVWN